MQANVSLSPSGARTWNVYNDGDEEIKAFALLIAEDLGSSVVALLIGLPIAILMPEVVSSSHSQTGSLGRCRSSRIIFTAGAVILTTVGFVAIKLAAFLILSGVFVRKQIGDSCRYTGDREETNFPAPVYGVSAVLGLLRWSLHTVRE